ncbi:MAG: T9SS type A sorting domain-containing protein [Bacteroidetes bacterium]|nr:T9SS type A sorting domain-containing protein [Bacteroidota bacterium]
MKRSLLILSLLLASKNFFAQDWIEKANKPGANLYEIQKEFYQFFEGKDVTIKSTGYKAFKRWEYFVKPRVYPSGDLSVLSQAAKNYSDFLIDYKNSPTGKLASTSSVLSATWVPVGPMGAPTGLVGGLPRKAGRDNFLTFHPTNPSTIYAGAAGGGLWETNNGGTSWTTNTDNLPVTAISDLVIDPTNPNNMFLATGGGDDLLSAFPVGSDGVYKSTNAGVTWTPCGLTFSVSQGRVIHKLVMDPTNPQIIFAATNIGIYRSTNGGTTWTSVSGANTWDIKFNPGNPTIVYSAGTGFYRSTNSGASFVNVSVPTSGASNRMAIAVTPTNPANVYLLASRGSDSQFMGVYVSTNDGATFTTASTTPNIIGNSCAGTSTGAGQGWYDLAIAASPTNPNEIVVGGVNVWKSTNGGVSWTVIGCWNTPSQYIHADIHELEYASNGTLYSTNDGGIYSYNGTNVWTDLTAQRNIAQIYKLGLSGTTPNVWITGHQDNGTNIKNGASYVASLAGDGMDCFVDRTNDNYMFAEQFNGSGYRSTNFGVSWTSITGSLPAGDWVTPWKQDPINAGTIYSGRSQLHKSSNYGTSWSQLGTTGGGGLIVEFAIAPSNNQVIYVLYSGSIRKTTDGGTTWTNVTGTAASGGALTFITIDPTDPNTAWVTVSGYNASSKVFQTVDGGATWMNISSNLPNLPANCSVYEPGSNDRIYIGMDVGIYYKDNSSTNWTLYNAGLPNVAIMDMEMTPAAPGKIFAATYGRGVYQAVVIQTTAAPVPNFSYYGGLCVGTNKTFNDNSSNTPTSWTWNITPTTGVTFNSTSIQNPTVNFANPGIYTVSLISANSFGPGPINTKTISVLTTPTLVLTSNSVTSCDQDPVTVTASGATTYTWSNTGGNSATATYTFGVDFTYTVTGANGACISTETVAVTIINCVGIVEIGANNASFKVFPNPASDNITLKMNEAKNIDVTIELFDAAGKLALKQPANFTKDKGEYKLNITSLARGVYALKVSSKEGSSQTLKILKE